jgi:hypothetical protein
MLQAIITCNIYYRNKNDLYKLCVLGKLFKILKRNNKQELFAFYTLAL